MANPGKPAARQSKRATSTQRKPAARAKPVQAVRTSGDREASHGDIALAAYYRAQERGFSPGAEMDDWLQAEQEIRATGTGKG